MIDPLPAAMGSVEPQYGSRVRSKRFKAARTVLPISKQLPVLLRCPKPILADVTLQLIHRVEAAALDETLGEAEGHRRVVRPRASREIERAAAHDVGDGRKRAGAPELECRPERIAGGEAEEDPAVACDHVGNGHVHTNCVMYARSGLRA